MRSAGIQLAEVGRQWIEQIVRDDVLGLSAELAYRFFLALFPFFIFLTALGGVIASMVGVQDPTRHFIDLLGTIMPSEAARLVRPEIEHVVQAQRPGILSLGIVAAIFFATGGTNATIKAMNRAYDVEETRPFWKTYLLAVGLTLLAGSGLVAAFVILVLGQFFGRQLMATLGLGEAF